MTPVEFNLIIADHKRRASRDLVRLRVAVRGAPKEYVGNFRQHGEGGVHLLILEGVKDSAYPLYIPLEYVCAVQGVDAGALN
jgi:hypothetical protein